MNICWKSVKFWMMDWMIFVNRMIDGGDEKSPPFFFVYMVSRCGIIAVDIIGRVYKSK